MASRRRVDLDIHREYAGLSKKATADEKRQKAIDTLADKISAVEAPSRKDFAAGSTLRKQLDATRQQPSQLRGAERARYEMLKAVVPLMKMVQKCMADGTQSQASGERQLESLRRQVRAK